MALLSGPLNLNGYPLTLGGNVFSTSTIQSSQVNAGDTIGYFAGGADKYGLGQYSGNRTRTFTSGVASGASVGWGIATATTGVFTDLLIANAVSINALVPLIAAAATLTGTLTAPLANLTTINNNQLNSNNAVFSNTVTAQVGNVQTVNSTNVTVSSTLTSAAATVTTLTAGQLTANNASVSNVLTASVGNVQTLTSSTFTSNNASVSNVFTAAVGNVVSLTSSQITANNASVSNVLTAAVGNVASLTSSSITSNNVIVSNVLTSSVGNITTVNSSMITSANANVTGFLFGGTANLTNLVVTGTVSLPPTNTVSANSATFSNVKIGTYIEQGGAVAANTSSVVFPLTGDTTQIFLKLAALGASVPAIRMAVSTGNAQTFDTAAGNYSTSILAQANSSLSTVPQTGAAYPTLVAGAKGALATHTVRLNYTGQINDSANGAFTSSLFDMTAAGMADATAGGGVYMNQGTVVYASTGNTLPTFVRLTLENTANTGAVPSYIRSSFQPISYL